jgi:DNA repair protein RecN (Recombination protein N)
MLKRLAIEQFVIIDKLAIDFKPGLTIVTGETGAGKSILLDAMGLILGDASDPESIRSGSQESVIEALFTPPATHPVWSFLVENNLANNAGGEFQIYRLIKRNGNDDNRVNGKPVDLDLLKKLGAYLVEIHGQFANQSITDPANQLKWLDLSALSRRKSSKTSWTRFMTCAVTPRNWKMKTCFWHATRDANSRALKISMAGLKKSA